MVSKQKARQVTSGLCRAAGILFLSVASVSPAVSAELPPGIGPDGPSIPFNILGWRADNDRRNPDPNKRIDGFEYDAGCRIVLEHRYTSVGSVVYRYPVCE